MFCPKCGVSNPENGKFCRGCGADLSHITGALSTPVQPPPAGVSGKPLTLENAVTKIFMGLAFLIVSLILGFSNTAGGRNWWFWMLIPAFGMLGTGFAQLIQVRKDERAKLAGSSIPGGSLDTPHLNELPQQISHAAPESRYKTGDLVPPSVTDNTTRQLEINSEGQTMTLPKK